MNDLVHTMNDKFGFLLFDGLEELDLVGPWEMISLWGKTMVAQKK